MKKKDSYILARMLPFLALLSLTLLLVAPVLPLQIFAAGTTTPAQGVFTAPNGVLASPTNFFATNGVLQTSSPLFTTNLVGTVTNTISSPTLSATNGYFNTVVATNGFTGNASTASYAADAGFATNAGSVAITIGSNLSSAGVTFSSNTLDSTDGFNGPSQIEVLTDTGGLSSDTGYLYSDGEGDLFLSELLAQGGIYSNNGLGVDNGPTSIDAGAIYTDGNGDLTNGGYLVIQGDTLNDGFALSVAGPTSLDDGAIGTDGEGDFYADTFNVPSPGNYFFDGNTPFLDYAGNALQADADNEGNPITSTYATQSGYYPDLEVGQSDYSGSGFLIYPDNIGFGLTDGTGILYATGNSLADNNGNLYSNLPAGSILISGGGGYYNGSFAIQAAADVSTAPTNTVTPVGWLPVTVNGNPSWIPYYQ